MLCSKITIFGRIAIEIFRFAYLHCRKRYTEAKNFDVAHTTHRPYCPQKRAFTIAKGTL